MRDDALARLRAEPIDWRHKGFPAAEGLTPATVGERGFGLLAGDLPTPVMVLKERALAHNLDLMARWCGERGLSLAPHGKTTMCPELWVRQLQAGAWGITVANAAQARVARAFGVERILLANELVEPVSIRWVAAELAADPAFDFLCLADSLAAVEVLAASAGTGRPIRVLVELGLPGGRTGCRNAEEALAVARAVASAPGLELAGVEGYEGILHGNDALAEIDGFLDRLRDLVSTLAAEGALAGGPEVVVSAGGSAFFDRVAERLAPPIAGLPVRLVLRSGCYVTHDSAFYDHLSPLGARSTGGPRLEAALEAWGAVLSRPEPELALVLLGKRDVPYDIDLPVPLRVASGGSLRDVRGLMTVTDTNDQHAYLRVPAGDPLAVGDLVGCGISHPCTAFDKWRLIPLVDDDYTVVDAYHTFF
ncbi:MAG: amino acid deaminase [Thermoleophilia bacterium]|nr:amino acid deaminase [Thermoleophilia bacterium]